MDGVLKTAGVYLYIDGYFVFAFGPNRNYGELGIVRIGGHIEHGESPSHCAIREAMEETNLVVELLESPLTFKMESMETKPEPAKEHPFDISPLLWIGENAMFLAGATGNPEPSSETTGLLLMTPSDIIKLCTSETRYEEYTAWGGRSVVKEEYPGDWIMKPFAQMRFLSDILQASPDILKSVFAFRVPLPSARFIAET